MKKVKGKKVRGKKAKTMEYSLRLIEGLTRLNGSVTSMYVARAQNKCLKCVHEFEKKDFETGGKVFPNHQGEVVICDRDTKIWWPK